MKILRSENEIMAQWVGDLFTPLVSICCITYNHESFIEQALHGFLIQETNFPFEIIIHDDASTDRTAAIVKEYESKYPKIIKSICQTDNQFSKGIRPLFILQPYCRGIYLAICEGDDFWTDPKKIQTQAHFLENNPDFVITGHDAFIVDEFGIVIADSKLPKNHKRDYSKEELILDKSWILTMSWMVKNIKLKYIPERSMVLNGDRFFISIMGHYGKSHYHSDIQPAGYRIHSGGVWSSLTEVEKIDSKINTNFWMYRYYKRIGEKVYSDYYWSLYLNSVFNKSTLIELTKEYIKKIIMESKIFVKYKILNATK